MRLADLRPRIVDCRQLCFDCPVHPGDTSKACHGEVRVILSPGTDGLNHAPPDLNAWRWWGDWSTWNVTLDPSVKLDRLCGAHFSIQGGIVRPA